MKCQSSSSSYSSLTVDAFYLMNRQKCCEGEEKLLSINQTRIYLFFNTDSSSSSSSRNHLRYQVLLSSIVYVVVRHGRETRSLSGHGKRKDWDDECVA